MGTLTFGQKKLLLEEGWLPYEIHAFDGAKTPSGHLQNFKFNSKPFAALRRSRIRYIKEMLNVGWTPMEIKDKLVSFHRKKGSSPFDFLKLAYKPARKLSNFQDAMLRKRANVRSKVTKSLGYNYGRELQRPKLLIRIKKPPRMSRQIIRKIRRNR